MLAINYGHSDPRERAILGTLYVHVTDDKYFLLVRTDQPFPTRFDQSRWRLVAVGVEPMTETAAHMLAKMGYHEYRTPVSP